MITGGRDIDAEKAKLFFHSIKPNEYRSIENWITGKERQEVLLLLILKKLDEISAKLDNE